MKTLNLCILAVIVSSLHWAPRQAEACYDPEFAALQVITETIRSNVEGHGFAPTVELLAFDSKKNNRASVVVLVRFDFDIVPMSFSLVRDRSFRWRITANKRLGWKSRALKRAQERFEKRRAKAHIP